MEELIIPLQGCDWLVKDSSLCHLGRAWEGLWKNPLEDFDRFMTTYEAAVSSFRCSDLEPSHLKDRYSSVIAPKLGEIKCFLAQSPTLRSEPLHRVTEMLLGVLEATEPASEERESLLYEMGLQFIRELKAEGLLEGLSTGRARVTVSSRQPVGEALAA